MPELVTMSTETDVHLLFWFGENILFMQSLSLPHLYHRPTNDLPLYHYIRDQVQYQHTGGPPAGIKCLQYQNQRMDLIQNPLTLWMLGCTGKLNPLGMWQNVSLQKISYSHSILCVNY